MATDFLTVEICTIKGLVTHHVLFFVDIASRTVKIAGITPHPDNRLMTQIARNLTDLNDGFLRRLTKVASFCRQFAIRVHDLKHTYGHRLRVAGIGFEDRKLLLGHKSEHVTTPYSAPKIGALIKASEKVCALGSRKSPALAIVRARSCASAVKSQI